MPRKACRSALSSLADQVGGCTAALMPLFKRLEAYVLSAERLHGDDTTVPVLAKGKTDTAESESMCATTSLLEGRRRQGRCSITCAIARKHPQAHLANYTGIFQADAYEGYGKLCQPSRVPGPIPEAACWVHARRPFFVMADLVKKPVARRKARNRR